MRIDLFSICLPPCASAFRLAWRSPPRRPGHDERGHERQPGDLVPGPGAARRVSTPSAPGAPLRRPGPGQPLGAPGHGPCAPPSPRRCGLQIRPSRNHYADLELLLSYIYQLFDPIPLQLRTLNFSRSACLHAGRLAALDAPPILLYHAHRTAVLQPAPYQLAPLSHPHFRGGQAGRSSLAPGGRG